MKYITAFRACVTLVAILTDVGCEMGGELGEQEIRLPMPSRWQLIRISIAGVESERSGELALDGKGRGHFDEVGWGKFDVLKCRIQPVIKGHGEIDITMVANPRGEKDTPRNYLGIYRFDGKNLYLCTAESSQPRPTDFASKASELQGLFIFKPFKGRP